jgi:type II secretory pathway pseudopilin PulG
MFSLFVTIIAIVLVVLLAAVTVYYGGSAYNNAQLNARVSTLISQGSQVKTAANAYAADNGGTVPSDISVLTDSSSSAGQYLTAVPSNPLAPTGATGATASWSIASGTATLAYASVQGICACEKFNEKYGGPPAATCAQDTGAANVPSCANLSESPGGTWAVNSPVCCQ